MCRNPTEHRVAAECAQRQLQPIQFFLPRAFSRCLLFSWKLHVQADQREYFSRKFHSLCCMNKLESALQLNLKESCHNDGATGEHVGQPCNRVVTSQGGAATD